MSAILFSGQSLCARCLRQLQFHQFRHFTNNPIRLNVSKLLSDIHNHKVNSIKKFSDPSKRRTGQLSKKVDVRLSKITTNSVDRTDPNRAPTTGSNKSGPCPLKEIQLAPTTESDVQLEIDSHDIFKELGLETYLYENLEDRDFLSSSVTSNENDEYSLFEDAHLTKKNLLGYIHVCIYNDNLSEAHAFLMEFIGKFSNSMSSKVTASCCELLIKAWARKGNPDNVRELMYYIKDSLKLPLNIHIYEYLLLALAKQIKETTLEDVQTAMNDIKKNSLKPEYLFYKSTLNSKEINIIRNLLYRFGLQMKIKMYSFPKFCENHHLKDIISTKQKFYDPFQNLDLTQMDAFVEQQFNSEMTSVVKVEPIDARFYDLEEKKSEKFYKHMIDLLEAEWKQTLEVAFKNYLKMIRSKHKRLNGIPFVHYMTILEPGIYVDTMLEEIRKCSLFSEHYSPFASQLFEALGRKVMAQYLLRSNLNDGTFEDFKKCYNKYVQYTMDPDLIAKYNPREYWQHLMESGYHYYFDEGKHWSDNVLREIGKDLYDIISNETKFNSDFLKLLHIESASVQPVISFLYKNHGVVKTKKEVRVHPLLIELYEGARSHIRFEAERIPMLSPPVPWLNNNFGGNLLIREFILRPPPFYPKQKLKKLPLQQMYPTYDSLNALSLCPWKINSKILDIAIHVFQNKGSHDLDIPISLSAFDSLPLASSEMSPQEKVFLYHKRKVQKKKQAEMYSLWVDCMYKLSIGNYLRDRVFWFPTNMDFRSRVYPIPPNFNHLGSDLSRALLLFAKGVALGEQGLKWLKIHLINLTGLKKKCSTDERLAYADEIIDLIMDSADRPFDGQKWWMQSDEKWQTLACCIELTNAIRSGNAHDYVSHIPIHQDGSCNGLQHYAALGRDILGAKSVNLIPSEYPQDVYSDVAALVEAEIDKDCEKGLEIAKELKGFISRKIVKHTVMTYVYGVTKYGAKLQVLRRLKDDANFPEAHKVTASLYISEKILLSIRKMFTQTRVIQDWLTNCAQIISDDYNSTVEWVTPLGFPVIQPYFKAKKHTLVPNIMKQKNAFPANYIHSLDSSHMMLTSLECHQNGLTFASVHDCYWTHASRIDEMNYFCRKQFVALHAEPLIDNLATHLANYLNELNKTRKVPNHVYLLSQVNQHINKGEFDLNSVMNSVYFFS